MRTGLSQLFILVNLFSAACFAVEPVRARLGQESAWTGEAVPLIITLYSPGPFSGTAYFELPDLPRTAIMAGGSPVIGTEAIDDETYFTQRHELTVYTQRDGQIEIPAFRVRFSGKKTFTSDPEPLEGLTPQLNFQSKRPPGTESLGLVVAAIEMAVRQTWAPDSVSTLDPGDVIQRTVTRRARGTSAMMMAPLSENAPDGVRVYVADPIVLDRAERGKSTAERTDTIKYQFERAGTFTIPDTTVDWWDAEAGELRRETLEGKTVSVEGDVAASAITEEPESRQLSVARLCAVVLGLGLFLGLGWKLIVRIQSRLDDPEVRAARRLLSACRAGTPSLAYEALLDWKRTVTASGDSARLENLLPADCAELQVEAEQLSRRIYGSESASEPWSGQRLAKAFVQVRRALWKVDSHRASYVLPTLNPCSASCRLSSSQPRTTKRTQT